MDDDWNEYDYDEIPPDELPAGTTSGRVWHDEWAKLAYLESMAERGYAVIYDEPERDPYGP